jgi:predicted nucleic acid-binding protein
LDIRRRDGVDQRDGMVRVSCGPVPQQAIANAAVIVGPPEPITEQDAKLGAELFNRAGRRRGSLADCLIAAVALRLGASLATENRSDFTPFVSAGLKILP